jgi:hypothetical protein
MLKKYPFHSFLIGLFPIMFIFAENPGQVNWIDTLLPLIVIELTVGILLLMAYWISKNWAVSGIYVSMLVVWFCSYGCFYNIFIGLTLNNVVLGRERWLILIWGLLFIVGLICLIKFRRLLPDFNRALNVVMPTLVGLLLLKAGVSYYKPPGPKQNAFGQIQSKLHRLTTTNPDTSKLQYFPSIYYIILDSYSASSILKDICGYDNAPFISYLKKNGFYVAEKSCSNYAVTGLSLPSSLNLDYLDAIFNLNEQKRGNLLDIPWQSLENNEITGYFLQRGYKTVKLGGGRWSPTATEKGKAGLAVATEFNIALLRMTLLRPIVEDMMAPLLRREIISAFDRMADLARSDEPHFVYAHIMCPHLPFIFGANGEEISLFQRITSRLNSKISYLNQVKYINKRVEFLINTLLKDSNSPPIIILQADHGSGSIFQPMLNHVPGDTEQDVKFLKAQFKILNAYYLPNGGEKYLYDSISPVNTFRVIINAYFGGHLELLPDRSIFSNYSSPYNFIDVTDKVQD